MATEFTSTNSAAVDRGACAPNRCWGVKSWSKAGLWLAQVIIVLLPTILLWNVNAQFSYDWHNHEWFIGYCGEYFRQHGAMPQVYNATPIVGMPQPIFYGWLFFPTLGAISAVTGAAIALRLAIVLGFGVQHFAVYVAARSRGYSRVRSTVLAAAVTWAVYPLTNLYNRAALTEFFAVLALNSAVALAVAASARRGTAASAMVWFAGLCAVAAVGTHPPTAVVGGMFLGLLLATAFLTARQRLLQADLLLPGGVVLLLAALALSPWIYANLRLHHDLYILVKLHRFAFFPDRTDSLVGRFAPFPYDGAALRAHGNVSTPFAEAQIAIPLLAICLANLVALFGRRWAGGAGEFGRSRRGLILVALAWFGLTTTLSLSPSVAGLFSGMAPYIQFPSRFVSHANLALLLAVLLMTAGEVGTGTARRRWAALYALAFVVSLVSVVIKLQHGAFVREIAPESRYAWQGDRSGLVTGGRMDAATDYASVVTLPQLLPHTVKGSPVAAFPVGVAGGEFGQVRDVRVDLPAPAWVVTNAVAFRWADVLVDRHRIMAANLAAVDHRLALYLPAGHHELHWEWHPDDLWVELRLVAAASAIGLLVGWPVLMFVACLRHDSRPCP